MSASTGARARKGTRQENGQSGHHTVHLPFPARLAEQAMEKAAGQVLTAAAAVTAIDHMHHRGSSSSVQSLGAGAHEKHRKKRRSSKRGACTSGTAPSPHRQKPHSSPLVAQTAPARKAEASAPGGAPPWWPAAEDGGLEPHDGLAPRGQVGRPTKADRPHDPQASMTPHGAVGKLRGHPLLRNAIFGAPLRTGQRIADHGKVKLKVKARSIRHRAGGVEALNRLAERFGLDLNEEDDIIGLDSAHPRYLAAAQANKDSGEHFLTEPADPAELLRNAKLNMMSNAVTLRVRQENQTTRDITEDDLDYYAYEWLPLWSTTPLQLAHLGVGVSLFFELTRKMAWLFAILTMLSAVLMAWYSAGTMVDDTSSGWEHFNGILSLGNLGICPRSGCSSYEELRSRCLLENAAGCKTVMSAASAIDTLDALCVASIIVVVYFFRYIVIGMMNRQAVEQYEFLGEYSVMVRGLPPTLDGDEGVGYLYAIGARGGLIRLQLQDLHNTKAEWEELQVSDIVSGIKSFDVFRDSVYVLSNSLIIFHANLGHLKSWARISGPPRGTYIKKDDGDDSLKGHSVTDCIRVYKGFLYCVGTGQRILRQRLHDMSERTQWQPVSRPGIVAFDFDSDVVYALDVHHCLVKQSLRSMTQTSAWESCYNFDKSRWGQIRHKLFGGNTRTRMPPEGVALRRLTSIALEGGYIYGVDAVDRRLYRQSLVALRPEASAWQEVHAGSDLRIIAIPGDPAHRHFPSKLGRHFLDVIRKRQGFGDYLKQLRNRGGPAQASLARPGAALAPKGLARSMAAMLGRELFGASTVVGAEAFASEHEMRVVLDRTRQALYGEGSESLGMRLRDSCGGLVVEDIRKGGIVDAWNAEHKTQPMWQIKRGHRIIEVNGQSDDPTRMRMELETHKPRFNQCPRCRRTWKRPEPISGECPHDGAHVDAKNFVALDIDKTISEITLVKNLNGVVSKLLEYADLLVDMDNTRAHIVKARWQREQDERARRSGTYRERAGLLHRVWWRKDPYKLEVYKKALALHKAAAQRLDEEIRERLQEPDAERPVVMAFITFDTQQIRASVLDEYAFSASMFGRWLQRRALRFQGRSIEVCPGPEPGDLYWENLDVPLWRVIFARGFTCLVTLALLSISVLVIAIAESPDQEMLASPRRAVWVIENAELSGAPCLNICDWRLSMHRSCQAEVVSSRDWGVRNLFDASENFVLGVEAAGGPNVFDGSGNCTSSSWSSPACSDSSAQDWLGIELDKERPVQCIQVTQSGDFQRARRLKIWACSEKLRSRNGTKTSRRDLSAVCIPMKTQEIFLAGKASKVGAFPSGNVRVEKDDACELSDQGKFIAIESARIALSLSDDDFEHPDYTCYCRQQLTLDRTMLAPPYDSQVKRLCERWSTRQVKSSGKALSGIIAVVTVSLVLGVVLELLAQREYHRSETELAKSVVVKLFFANYFNGGIIPVAVHMRVDFLPPWLEWVKNFGLFDGQFRQPTPEWFTEVGSTISGALLGSSLSALACSILFVWLEKYVNWPAHQAFQVTQDALNRKYLLPPFDLHLRLSMNLYIWAIAITWGPGLPILYPIGLAYSVASYWVDKWCLLRGSSRPPAYTHVIIVTALELMPFVIFMHSLIAAIAFSDQNLLPSGWSPWVEWTTRFFGLSLRDYEDVQRQWRDAEEAAEFRALYRLWFFTRCVDLGREGAWRVSFVIWWYFAYYCCYIVYSIMVLPFVKPFLLVAWAHVQRIVMRSTWYEEAQRDVYRWTGGRYGQDHSRHLPFNDVVEAMNADGLLTSYGMQENPNYEGAARSIGIIDDSLRAPARQGDGAEGLATPAALSSASRMRFPKKAMTDLASKRGRLPLVGKLKVPRK